MKDLTISSQLSQRSGQPTTAGFTAEIGNQLALARNRYSAVGCRLYQRRVYLIAPKIRARGRGQPWRAWPAAIGILSLGLGVFLLLASGRPGLLDQFAGISAFASVAANNAAEFETVTTGA